MPPLRTSLQTVFPILLLTTSYRLLLTTATIPPRQIGPLTPPRVPAQTAFTRPLRLSSNPRALLHRPIKLKLLSITKLVYRQLAGTVDLLLNTLIPLVLTPKNKRQASRATQLANLTFRLVRAAVRPYIPPASDRLAAPPAITLPRRPLQNHKRAKRTKRSACSSYTVKCLNYPGRTGSTTPMNTLDSISLARSDATYNMIDNSLSPASHPMSAPFQLKTEKSPRGSNHVT